MNLIIQTRVTGSLAEIKKGFNESLFLALAPPFPKVRLLRFDGCRKGDVVSLQLDFLIFRQEWTSEIILDYKSDEEWVFIDSGVKLPFFLRNWRHEHRVEVANTSCIIVDQIHYTTGTKLTDLLMFPALYLQFAYRKPIYKRFFN